MGFDPDSARNDGARSLGGSGDAATDKNEAAGKAVIEFVMAPAKAPGYAFKVQHGIWAAGFLLALGAGAFGLQSIRSASSATAALDKKADATRTAELIGRLQDEIGSLKGSVDTLRTAADASKQEDTIKSLKKSVENLRQEVEQSRSNDGAALAQLSSKIDKADHDPSQKLAEISARLDKLDHDPKDKSAEAANQKLADVAARIERIERQVASATPTGSIPPAAAAQRPAAAAPQHNSAASTATVPLPVEAPKPPVKPSAKLETSVVAGTDPKLAAPARSPAVSGWVLRDVYDGMALVEAREGGLREIAPGEFLPGAGEVRSIERRGGNWVVLTSRGVIESNIW